MQSRERNGSVARAAGRGALAGLIGGAAMTAAERMILPRFPGRRAPRIVRWDERLAEALGVVGWEMSPRVRTIAGIATQLLYAALLGAAYGAATSRRSSHATRQLVDAGLVFAAALLSPELPREPRQRRSRRSRAAKLRLLALAPITPSRVFGQTTTLALKALTR